MQFVPMKSEERGHADHGWLKTYQDHKHELFGPLRVINDDRVAARNGFGTHSSRIQEFFHTFKDSISNTDILNRGAVQLTSGGTGISHSEKAQGPSLVHFLQIWSLPHIPGLALKHYTLFFSDSDKLNHFEREGEGPASVMSKLGMWATMVEPGVGLEVKMEGMKGYVHLVQTSGYCVGAAQGANVRVGQDVGQGEVVEVQVKGANETILWEGDGTYVFVGERGNVFRIENEGEGVAGVVVFDLE
ncbi:RmlC-like cupin domain-containing protein [Panaeolus papilionaceus]|nr:RmlC-like cupin domain-containing protein [Panaeolus papilionaceus]